MIEINDLSKKFGTMNAIEKVSLRIKKKEVIALMGENGSGKTTFLSLLSGVIRPSSGSILMNGKKMGSHTLSIQKKIGYLSQKNPLYEHMTVYEFLEIVAYLHKIKKEAIRWKIKKVIRICSLKGVISRKISVLAKGDQQRVGLAQALIHDPDLLLLDEPSAGLDIEHINEMKQIISQIGQRRTVIICTHRISDLKDICSRVISFKDGKLFSDKRLKV